MATNPGFGGGWCTITYGEDRRKFNARPGTRLLDAILAHEPNHRHVCGGNGFCTSCRVHLEQGSLGRPSRLERERLGYRCGELRLACQCRLEGDVTIVPPRASTFIDW